MPRRPGRRGLVDLDCHLTPTGKLTGARFVIGRLLRPKLCGLRSRHSPGTGAGDTLAVLAACRPQKQRSLKPAMLGTKPDLLARSYTPSKNWIVFPGASVTTAFFMPGFLITVARPARPILRLDVDDVDVEHRDVERRLNRILDLHLVRALDRLRTCTGFPHPLARCSFRSRPGA